MIKIWDASASLREAGGLTGRVEPATWPCGLRRPGPTLNLPGARSAWRCCDVRHHADSLRDRAGRPARRRATPAAGLRRAAATRRCEARPGEAGADAPGHGPGPRGL